MGELELVANGMSIGFTRIEELMALLGVAVEWDSIKAALGKVAVHGTQGNIRLGLIEQYNGVEMVA